MPCIYLTHLATCRHRYSASADLRTPSPGAGHYTPCARHTRRPLSSPSLLKAAVVDDSIVWQNCHYTVADSLVADTTDAFFANDNPPVPASLAAGSAVSEEEERLRVHQ